MAEVVSEGRWKDTVVNQRADSNKDVRHARPMQCDGNYHGAAHMSVIVHVVIYHRAARVSIIVHVVIIPRHKVAGGYRNRG